ncbi:MAG: hypothetical protein SH848_21960 [Saprospiraceae bacterium]|nr:hypothetical protein [Saprospiraceae bacterium]MDZ4706610.1 hypothetical protein [Saprospiraceae bacterium]
MATSALIMWLTTVTIVASFCGFFFYKILTTKSGGEQAEAKHQEQE